MKNLIVILLFLASCSKSDAILPISSLPKTDLFGVWRYVGTFSHLADYKCIICPDYDYENEKYQITFKEMETLMRG